MKRVIEGWKKACGRYWIPEEKRRTTTIEAHWSRPTKALSIVGELKKMQDLDDLLKPSAWMSMPARDWASYLYAQTCVSGSDPTTP